MIFERLLLNKDKEGIYVRQSILLTSVTLLLSGQRKVTETVTYGHHGPNCAYWKTATRGVTLMKYGQQVMSIVLPVYEKY